MKKTKTEILPYVFVSGEKKAPLVFYRSYDMTAAIGRRNEKTGAYQGKPMELHLSGEGECPLMRVALIGCAVAMGAMLISAGGKLLCAMRYKRRYQKKYEQKLREKERKLDARLEKEKEKAVRLRADARGVLQKELCESCR